MSTSIKKSINRVPEQGSISKLDEMQKKSAAKTNTNIPITNLQNPSNITYETPSTINLNSFYPREEGGKFLQKIEKLNLNFLILSDKYLKRQSEIEKVKDNLFINLFKQISLYVEEIEKLNLRIKEKEGNAKSFREKNIKELSKELAQNKTLIKSLESKLSEKNQNEEKLKREVASYKRQITFYKDKLKLDLKTQKERNKHTVHYQTNNSYINVNNFNYSSTVLNTTNTTTNKKVYPNSSLTSPYTKLSQPTKSVKKVTLNSNTSSSSSYKKTHKKNLSLSDEYTISNRDPSRGKMNKSVIHHTTKSVASTQRNNIQSSILDNSRNINSFFSDTKKENTLEGKGGISFMERQTILEDIGGDINNNYDKEIKTLIEQENEIAKILKIIDM